MNDSFDDAFLFYETKKYRYLTKFFRECEISYFWFIITMGVLYYYHCLHSNFDNKKDLDYVDSNNIIYPCLWSEPYRYKREKPIAFINGKFNN